MHLVDDIYLIFALNRRVLYLLPDLPDVVHTVVGSGVNLKDIQRTLIVDGLTGRTLVARIASTGCWQLTALAKSFAMDVLPVPRVPQKRYACPILS